MSGATRSRLAVATLVMLVTPACTGVAHAQPPRRESLAAASGAGLPAPLVALAILVALLGVTAGILVLARWRGWDPAWAAAAGHAIGEAGYRLGGSWSLLLELPRAARPGEVPPAPADPVVRVTQVPSPRRRSAPALAVAAGTLVAAVAVIALVSGASAPPAGDSQQSSFQDDSHLLRAPTATVQRVLGVLSSSGVDGIRIGVTWARIAPDPRARARPAFDATNPSAYPPDGWVAYDRLVRLARAHGLAVDFNVAGPGPLWAMGRTPGHRGANHYLPSARELGLFVVALGRRYSGVYAPTPAEQAASAARAGLTDVGPLPRVTRWSIWSEPNQPASLAPQWRAVGGAEIPSSPGLYRAYVNEALAALEATGHPLGRDSLLIGELAPAGGHTPGGYAAMTPIAFLRALYCVDPEYRPLSGRAALASGCPSGVGRRAFVTDEPGLFTASGFAMHPYDQQHSPDHVPSDPDFVTLSTLGRLSGGLDRIFRGYGVGRRLPVYATNYGHATRSPGHLPIVAPAQRASDLDQAGYIAWRATRLRSFVTLAPRRPPIWLVARSPGGGSHAVIVWGQLRFARLVREREVQIEWSADGTAYRQVATATPNGREGYFTTTVHPPGPGMLRLQWRSSAGRSIRSRAAALPRETAH